MPRIYVLSGPDLGRTFDVETGATFGRTAECAVVLRDASVSRSHARLEGGAVGWRIVDIGSRNGLFTRDERVQGVDLADGDEFRLGEVQLRFRADVAAPEVARPAAAGPEIHFHTGGDLNDDALAAPEEIELEGDWSTAAAPPLPPAASAPSGASSGSGASSMRPAPVAAPRSRAIDERARKLAAAGVAVPRATPAEARGVLQFHKVEQAEGVLRQDLGQQPAWLRYTVILVVLAVTLGLAWLGFQAATAAKARLAPADAVSDEPR